MGKRWEKGNFSSYRWLVENDRVSFIMVDFQVDLSSLNKYFYDLNRVPLRFVCATENLLCATYKSTCTWIETVKLTNKCTVVIWLPNEHFSGIWFNWSESIFRLYNSKIEKWKCISRCVCMHGGNKVSVEKDTSGGKWWKKLPSADDIKVDALEYKV